MPNQLESPRDLGEPGKDNRFGAGLLDAFAAVQEARKLSWFTDADRILP